MTPLALADGHEHGSGGMTLGTGSVHQFRAFVDDPPDEGVGGFGLGRCGDLHPPFVDGGDVQQRKNLVLLRGIQIQREIIPLERARRPLHK